MRVLFVSRAFPPVMGGIEKHNADLAHFLGERSEMTLIANRHGKRLLPLFYPWALFRVLLLAPRHDVILLGDGVLALLGYLVKKCYPRKAVVTVLHGLDVTYPVPIYQKFWTRIFFHGLDGAIAVSSATKSEAISRGFDPSRIFVIPNGIVDEDFRTPMDRSALSKLLGFETESLILLLTVGRLVKRKGVAWFIDTVLPKLPEHVHYVVAGAGPEEETIREMIKKHNLLARVHMLGRVSGESKALLLSSADIFVQPNIPVVGDMEGFGIAVIEASASGLPVVAARLEGLIDAVTHGENGLSVEPENASAFVEAITTLLDSEVRSTLSKRASEFTHERFSWPVVAASYITLLDEFSKSTHHTH